MLEILFLGTGTSHGIPVIGCNCGVCQSSDPKNKRNRSSILLTQGDTNILIDTATELRLQALRFNITSVDAVLYTHFHADHVFGFDDLRRFNNNGSKPIPVYGNAETIEELRQCFAYVFRKTQEGSKKPLVTPQIIQPVPTVIHGLTFQPIPIYHGQLGIYGYRFGNVAYITDCSKIPEQSEKLLKDLDILILGVLRYRPHPTHFNLNQALKVIAKLKPNRTYFTHICHDFDHEQVQRELPPNCYLGYDGLRLETS
ncbi:MAG: MBL fold metallo-hydrolase [Limnochordia bacterium]|nr:MBL fold metallo-hydrolase [Limnochordia bacterium]